jgi:TIR domain
VIDMTQPDSNDVVISSPLKLRSKNDTFISYSRKDKAFVEQLIAKFHQADRKPWIDWDDIYKGEDWWQSIQRGIEGSDNFIFVISPDSVTSAVCRSEVDYAAQLNKRFLPLLWQEGFDQSKLHPSIAQYNWIFCRESDDIDRAFQELVEALDTDLDYVRAHTRLIMRSLEWLNRGQNNSYLLRGIDLDAAQHWLSQGIHKIPKPTDDQIAYINTSIEARFAAIKARQKAKWIVVLTTVISNLAFVAGGLYSIYWSVNKIAQNQVAKTMENTLNAALAGIDGDAFEKLTQIELPPGQNEPTDNPLYQRHQTWLKTVHEIAPEAFPSTYIMGTDNKLIAIGDIYRIADQEYAIPYKAIVPDKYVTRVMREGLERVSLNLSPNKEYVSESWISISGPIRNSEGKVVGALGLDYESTYWTDLQDAIRRVMVIAGSIAFIWLVVSSWLILKATQPFSENFQERWAASKTWLTSPMHRNKVK